MANPLQGIYAPLPQSLSDSDSEKELAMEDLYSLNRTISQQPEIKECKGDQMDMKLINDMYIKRGKSQMSTWRKVAFVFSLLMCCLPIVVFLWILPCSELNRCPIKMTNWEYQHEDIEFKGKINVVNNLFNNGLNLVVIYKGSISLNKSYNNGVMSFMGSKRTMLWVLEQEYDPLELDCSILDADNDDIKDCLLRDSGGLKAIHTISGLVLWHVHNPDEKKSITNLTLAVKLDDFNEDNISEILAVHQDNTFLIISGKTGEVLAKTRMNRMCHKISDTIRVDGYVQFACKNLDQTVYYQVAIKEFYNNFVNMKFVIKPKKIYGKKFDKVFVAGTRKLIVENDGVCPHCHSTVSLYDNKSNNLKSWHFRNSYVMTPAPFSLQDTLQNIMTLKGHVTGFVIKIWKWSSMGKQSIDITKKRPFYVNQITERLMLILCNTTGIQEINASDTEINQLCFNESKSADCQPNHTNQDYSVLVADLNQDNTQELISYSSSYENKLDNWSIVSNFKVFRLESELPKLYDSK